MHFLILTLCLMAHSLRLVNGSDDCCRGGYDMALKIVRSESNVKKCTTKPSLLQGKSEFEKSLCDNIFKSYCELAASNQFCMIGVQFAMANQVCAGVEAVGGNYRQLCCGCCKSGKEHGMRGDDCSIAMNGDNDVDNLCKISFKECCMKSRDMALDSAATEAPIESGEVTAAAVVAPQTPVKCPRGHEVVDGKCQDINECTTGTQQCPPVAYCNNNKGAYVCYSNCPTPTYTIVRERAADLAGICADTDECATGTAKCSKHHKCENTVGGYSCKRISCEVGYTFLDGHCEDLDECENKEICGTKGNCRNAHGTYYCDCADGYTVDPSTKKCVDKNECEISNICQFKCRNTEGSYECYCPHGYKLEGRYCQDVDECKTNPCGSSGSCFNTYGGYHCINDPCPEYYTKTRYNTCTKTFCRHNDFRCKMMKEYSIKWQAFKLYLNLPPRFFQFMYSLSNFGDDINFHFAIVSGNDDHTFDIERKGKGKVAIFNAKKLTESKDYKIKMYADVRRGIELITRYTYNFYFFVSPYQF